MSPFVGKDWQDTPSTATPITAVALEDMETRLSAYTDTSILAALATIRVAAPSTATANRTAIQAAIDSAATYSTADDVSYGAVVQLQPGRYDIDGTLTMRQGVVLRGAGKKTTIIRRTTNAIILDVIGTPGTAISGLMRNMLISDIELNSSSVNRGTWVTPFLRIYYAQFVHLQRVNFMRAGGSGISAVQWWDSAVDNCRWDFCGDATHPACHVKVADQGVSSGVGSSADTSNNIHFNDCTFEQNPGIDLHIDGRQFDGTYNSTLRAYGMRIRGLKSENATVSGADGRLDTPRVLLENTAHWTIDGAIVSARATVSGNDTNLVHLNTCYDGAIEKFTAAGIDGTSPVQSIRTGLRVENCTGVEVSVVGHFQAVNFPSVGLLEYAGTNTEIIEGRVYFDFNPSGALERPVTGGTPTSYAATPSTVALATDVSPGLVRLSNAAAVLTDPIAVSDNDARLQSIGGADLDIDNIGFFPANVTLDMRGRNFVMFTGTLQANTLVSIQNIPAGGRFTLDVTQDSAGGHTVSFGAAAQTPTASSLTISGTAGDTAQISGYSPDGNILRVRVVEPAYRATVVNFGYRSKFEQEFASNATWAPSDLPSGWQPGDTCLLFIANDSNRTLTGPTITGWTLLQGPTDNAGTADVRGYLFYRRLRVGDGPPSFTWVEGGVIGSVLMMAYSGVDATSPIVGSLAVGTGQATSVTTPALDTTGVDGAMVVGFAAVDQSATTVGGFYTWTGMTERSDFEHSTTFLQMGGADHVRTTGTSATQTVTFPTNDSSVVMLVALRPPGVTGGPATAPIWTADGSDVINNEWSAASVDDVVTAGGHGTGSGIVITSGWTDADMDIKSTSIISNHSKSYWVFSPVGEGRREIKMAHPLQSGAIHSIKVGTEGAEWYISWCLRLTQVGTFTAGQYMINQFRHITEDGLPAGNSPHGLALRSDNTNYKWVSDPNIYTGATASVDTGIARVVNRNLLITFHVKWSRFASTGFMEVFMNPSTNDTNTTYGGWQTVFPKRFQMTLLADANGPGGSGRNHMRFGHYRSSSNQANITSFAAAGYMAGLCAAATRKDAEASAFPASLVSGL